MSNDWVQDIADMHRKFGVNDAVRKMDADKLKALSCKVFPIIQQTLNKGNLLNTDTKSVEYRLHIRRGTHARGKRENK